MSVLLSPTKTRLLTTGTQSESDPLDNNRITIDFLVSAASDGPVDGLTHSIMVVVEIEGNHTWAGALEVVLQASAGSVTPVSIMYLLTQ